MWLVELISFLFAGLGGNGFAQGEAVKNGGE